MAGAGFGVLKMAPTPIATHESRSTIKRRQRKVDGGAKFFIKDEHRETSEPKEENPQRPPALALTIC